MTSEQKAVDALRAYLRKESEEAELYYDEGSGDFVDGHLDLAAVVRVVRDALKASPPAPREPVK